MFVEYRDRDYIEIIEGSKFVVYVGIILMEGIEYEIFGEGIEYFNISRKENSIRKVESYNETVNFNSEMIGSGFIIFSVNIVRV